MTPTFHPSAKTHDQRLENILFQCENILGYGAMARDADTRERRAEALDAIKVKARCLLAALEDAHFTRMGDVPRIAYPFPIGSRVRIYTARHHGAAATVVRVNPTLQVQLDSGGTLLCHNCDLETLA